MNIPPGKLRDWLDARLGSDGLDAVMFLMNHMVIWSPPRCNVASTRLGEQIGSWDDPTELAGLVSTIKSTLYRSPTTRPWGTYGI